MEVHLLACQWANYKIIETLTKEDGHQSISLRDVRDVRPGNMGHDIWMREGPKT